MKKLTMRLGAFLMALVLLVGLLPAVQIQAAATVDYVTDSTTGYIYNWGTREEEATFLSPNAEAFYTASGTSYDALSALTGSANLSSVPSSDLYEALQTLMTEAHDYQNSYDASRTMFQYTDVQNSAKLSNKISSFYSGAAIGPAWDSGATWNREHTWPNSKGLEGRDEDDIMMLRPASTTENGSRSNTCYGESDGYYYPNTESNDTYDVRGDVARIALYVYVRWGNTEKLWGPDTNDSGVIESKEIMLKWMEEDPVDTWELGRNDSVESITGTRNVFVDYPELAFLLLGEAIPTDMVTPSGEAADSGIDYILTAVSNNEAFGSTVVSGNVINAIPAEGYYAESCTVTAGNATVTRSGNAFIVTATADCTVQINFAQLEEVAVSFSHNGTVVSADSYSIGDQFNLPEYSGELNDGCVFAGWSEVPVSATEDLPAIYKAGDVYTVSAAATLYAVYAYLDESSDPSDGEWTLVTDDSVLHAGNQLLLAYLDTSICMVSGDLNSSYLTAVSASALDRWIPEIPASAVPLTLGGSEGAWTLANGENLLGIAGDKKLAWNSGTTTWNISVTDGVLTLAGSNGQYGKVQYNSQSPRFTNYSSTQKMPVLYVLDTDMGTLHYTTEIVVCAHSNTVNVAEQAPTATQAGWTAGVYCYDCSTYIEGHQRIVPSGSDCVVSFLVPEGVTAIDSTVCTNAGLTLPTAAAPAGYTFVGWVETAVDNSAEEPDILHVGSIYHPSGTTNAVLYALYTYQTSGTKTSWVLADELSDLVAGKQVIIAAAGYDVALSTNQKTNNRGEAAITKNSDNTATFGDDVQILTLEAGTADGTYGFNTGSGYLYAASSSSNYLRTQTSLNANASFKIELTNGVWTAIAQGSYTRNNLRYNSSASNGKLFSCYASGQQPICFYVKTETAGETVNCYTTVIGSACVHANTTLSGQSAPTCTEAGSTGSLVCNDCTATLTVGAAIPATGHACAAFVPAQTGSCEIAGWEAHYACGSCGRNYLEKTVTAAEYVLPAAPGHDYTEDPTTCGTCGHVRMTLALNTVTLKSSVAGLYYKGQFTFDEETGNSILGYGIAVSLTNPEPVADGSDETCLYTEGTVSAVVANIMEGTDKAQNSKNARMQVYARAYVQLADGTYVYSGAVSASLRQMVQAIDDQLWSSLTQAQKDGLKAMYESFADVMAGWNIPNLKEYIAG